jgi:hypothetical protein
MNFYDNGGCFHLFFSHLIFDVGDLCNIFSYSFFVYVCAYIYKEKRGVAETKVDEGFYGSDDSRKGQYSNLYTTMQYKYICLCCALTPSRNVYLKLKKFMYSRCIEKGIKSIYGRYMNHSTIYYIRPLAWHLYRKFPITCERKKEREKERERSKFMSHFTMNKKELNVFSHSHSSHTHSFVSYKLWVFIRIK